MEEQHPCNFKPAIVIWQISILFELANRTGSQLDTWKVGNGFIILGDTRYLGFVPVCAQLGTSSGEGLVRRALNGYKHVACKWYCNWCRRWPGPLKNHLVDVAWPTYALQDPLALQQMMRSFVESTRVFFLRFHLCGRFRPKMWAE
jgi:hypothetical protein